VKRIILLVTVAALMAVMVALSAGSAFAQQGADVGTANCAQGGEDLGSGQGVITPSGNINAHCNENPAGGNPGGSGGGPAIVADDEDLQEPPLIVGLDGPREIRNNSACHSCEAHGVETPSNNTNTQLHLHPVN
jgi:hypothetical protein